MCVQLEFCIRQQNVTTYKASKARWVICVSQGSTVLYSRAPLDPRRRQDGGKLGIPMALTCAATWACATRCPSTLSTGASRVQLWVVNLSYRMQTHLKTDGQQPLCRLNCNALPRTSSQEVNVERSEGIQENPRGEVRTRGNPAAVHKRTNPISYNRIVRTGQV